MWGTRYAEWRTNPRGGAVQEGGQPPQAAPRGGRARHAGQPQQCLYVEAMNGLLQQAKRAARGFRTATHFIAIAYLRMSKLRHLPSNPLQPVGAPHLWLRIVEFLEQPELKMDERFLTAATRRNNWAALSDMIRRRLDRFSSAREASNALAAARIPAVPVLTPHEVILHPQLIQRGAFPSVDYHGGKKVRVTATPFQLDGQPTAPRSPAPLRVGEHTQHVLAKILGYDPDRIKQLEQDGVVTIV